MKEVISFKCPSCGVGLPGWPSLKCDACHWSVKIDAGVFLFSAEENLNVKDNQQGYVGFDVIAPNYDNSRDRYGESLMGSLVKRKLDVGSCIVDLGAGTGYHSLSLAKEGYNVIAADISVKMLQILSSKMNTTQRAKVLPYKMNAYSLPLRDHSIKAFFVDLFHLIENPQQVLEEIARTTKPGGYLFNVLYSGESLTPPEEKALYLEVVGKLDFYYKEKLNARGISLLKRFGWIGQKEQQTNLRQHYELESVEEDARLNRSYTMSIQRILGDYRNRTLVDQALLNPIDNSKIVLEVEKQLEEEYGLEFKRLKLVIARVYLFRYIECSVFLCSLSA